jgi:hypothetical protein
LVAAAAVVASSAFAATPAHAGRAMEAQFQDDAELVYRPISRVSSTLDILQQLGVDRVRVTLFWRLVAPSATSEKKPAGFNATDPDSYPAGNWKRYDQLIRAANERGMFVNLNISGPAPDWAMPSGGPKDFPLAYKPNLAEWAAFVKAAARRYDGTFAPRNPNPPPPPAPNPNPLSLDSLFGQQPTQQQVGDVATTDPVLPPVHYWSLWNEPNQPTFLTPQNEGGREASPRVYRGLADNAFASLVATGHGGDTILIGETAPRGRRVKLVDSTMSPLRFMRGLYCVDGRLRFLKGAQAKALGCPSTPRTFAGSHPVLFASSGYAHHPYTLLTPPFVRSDDSDNVGVADISRMTNTLDGIFRRYNRPTGFPIYITEFGYQSKPPDPYGYPQTVAAAFINESEFTFYKNPRVRSTHQFLLRDDPPLTAFPANSPAYWSTFQTGLITDDEHAKQSFGAYRMPLWVTPASRGSAGLVRVWGGARPAPNATKQTLQVQFRPFLRKTKWHVAKTVTTRSTRNYIDTRVRIPLSGSVRLAWKSPSGAMMYSRVQFVSIG